MLSQLQLDLRELSQEARKKETELKEVRTFRDFQIARYPGSNLALLSMNSLLRMPPS